MVFWAIFLEVVIKYGKAEVNRLTLRPLKWTLAVALLQTIIGIFQSMVTKDSAWIIICGKQNTDIPIFLNSWEAKIGFILDNAVDLCFVGFISAVMNENLNFFMFILFQKSISLEYLDWARPKY